MTVPPRTIRSNRGDCALTRTQRRTEVTKADTKTIRQEGGEGGRETGDSVTQAGPRLCIAVFLCVLCSPLCPCPPPASREGFHDPVRFESLGGEITVQPLEFLVVLDRVAPAQPLVQRGFDAARRRRSIRRPRRSHASRSTCRCRPSGSAAARELRPRRRTLVSVRAIASATRASSSARSCAQPRDGIVDRVGSVAFAGEPLTDLLLGQLSPSQHLQAVDVGRHHSPSP